MSESEKSAALARFSGITGLDPERSQFYLESSNWNLDLAIATFYQDDDDDRNGSNIDVPQPPQAATQAGRQAQPAQATAQGRQVQSNVPTASKPKPSTSSRIATISNLPSDSDSEEEGEAYYAGGSERGGGQQVLGPPKKRADKLVQEMFEAAKEHGAEEVVAGSASAQSGSGARNFFGAGYRLGDKEDVTEVVQGAAKKAPPRDMNVVLKLWKNGFSANDGPLRRYDDPMNREFLESIKKGEIPRELVREAHGGEVNLDMEDHRNEEYVPPKPQLKPFIGEGHRLGSVAPTIVANTPTQNEDGENAAKAQIVVDNSKPTTSVQIRLADGSRMVLKLNHSNTVMDIRNYITAARPQMTANFALMTTFPNKELGDLSQTIEDAKLINAVIVQRMK